MSLIAENRRGVKIQSGYYTPQNGAKIDTLLKGGEGGGYYTPAECEYRSTIRNFSTTVRTRGVPLNFLHYALSIYISENI